MHKGDRNIHGVRWKLQCIKSENVLQFPHPSCRTSFNFCVVFSPYFNMRNLLEIVSIITVFSSLRYIAGHLQKGNAEQFQSLHHGSYLCLPSGHIHIPLPPTAFQEESLWISGNKRWVAPCLLCHFRWIRSHQQSGEKPEHGVWVYGSAMPGRCAWQRKAQSLLLMSLSHPREPYGTPGTNTFTAPGSCSAEPATSQSIPAAPAAPAVEGSSCWFLKKTKKQNAGVRRVAEELSL